MGTCLKLPPLIVLMPLLCQPNNHFPDPPLHSTHFCEILSLLNKLLILVLNRIMKENTTERFGKDKTSNITMLSYSYFTHVLLDIICVKPQLKTRQNGSKPVTEKG